MRVEHLDDLPVLGSQIQRMGLSGLLDNHFPDHGLWKGISGGKLAEGWLMYILSEGDHRLSHVEEWAELRLESLGAILGESELRVLDFSDDRLGRLLDRYSDDEEWNALEIGLGRQLLQVYGLESGEEESLKVVRSDSFNAPQFREEGDLFTYGYSKHRRSDQPFCKVMMASMDPLSVPLAVEILKGSGPDVDHYLSVIKRVQSILGKSGNLYVGDSQLGSMSNRLAIQMAGDYYLSPLNRKQVSLEKLHAYLAEIKKPIRELPSLFTGCKTKRKPAYYYEVKEIIRDEERELEWEERRVLVYSPQYAEGLIKSLNNRLNEAEQAIKKLVISKKGRRNPKTLKDLHTRVDVIVKKYKVAECFEVKCNQSVESYVVKRYKNREAEERKKVTLSLELKRKEGEIELKRKQLGWQIYGTNAKEETIGTGDLVRSYRDEYRIEHLFDYMINRDVGLLPIFLQKEERVKGLIRLLSIAMRFSMLLQYDVRNELEKKRVSLKESMQEIKIEVPTSQQLQCYFEHLED